MARVWEMLLIVVLIVLSVGTIAWLFKKKENGEANNEKTSNKEKKS